MDDLDDLDDLNDHPDQPVQPDLSLPPTVPDIPGWPEDPEPWPSAALYSLVDLDKAELEELKNICEEKCDTTASWGGLGNIVRIAPQPYFVGRPLRAVMEYHLKLGRRHEYDPFWFIVAVDRHWRYRGVLLVTTDDDADAYRPDSFRIRAEHSGMFFTNLVVNGWRWSEEGEEYRLDLGISSSEENTDDDDGGNAQDDFADDGPPAPSRNVPLGYYVPIYIHSSLIEDQVIARLEPEFTSKTPDEIVCRIQAKLTPTYSATTPYSSLTPTQNLIAQAIALHPIRCAKNSYLHRRHILVIDTPNPNEYGMQVVQLPRFNPDCVPRSRSELLQLGHDLAFVKPRPRPIRIPYSCHEGLQTRFLSLANGDTIWPCDEIRTRRVFTVFRYGMARASHGFGADSLDPNAAGWQPGDERVIMVPELIKGPGIPLQKIAWSCEEAVRRFPWICRELGRFVEKLDLKYFVLMDGLEPGVWLVRRDWDGRIWGRIPEELLDLPLNGFKRVRVPTEQALATLERGRVGDTRGMSGELARFFTQEYTSSWWKHVM